MQIRILLFLLCTYFIGSAQKKDITQTLYETYEKYQEKSLDKRRIKHYQLQPLLKRLETVSKFKVTTVGHSIEGRELSLISLGQGKTQVFLWSQMHGNEPTATQAIFDILNFFTSPDFQSEKQEILENVSLHFLPMLNPDGAERFQRRNVLGVDINRDALRLQSPESKTLKKVRDSLNADFGFNLHDQSTYYNAERTNKPATISYLAPAYNYEKDINESRGDAMKIIVFMNKIIQQYAPGQVGRYNDDFEPRAFGDNIQKWGTSTILIESGGFHNDIEKQEIRKLNYVSILSAIYSIATKNYKDFSLTDYEKIPENDRKLFDLKITNATYEINGKAYLLDLGINRLEVAIENSTDFWYSSRIIDQGDLSTYYGYETFDATGYTIKSGKTASGVVNGPVQLNEKDVLELLKSGITYVPCAAIPVPWGSSFPLPIHLIGENYVVPNFTLEVGVNPTFLLEKDGLVHFVVINGFLLDLNTEQQSKRLPFKNAIIYR